MLPFRTYLIEESEEGSQLKHIHHAEDRPLFHGHAGFEHAYGALTKAHEHMKAKAKSANLTMKYDGSPSIVFGHHPQTGKFFVASKSAFNKNPKINYSPKDIEKGIAGDEDKRVVARARKVQRFLSQPFFVAEQFTGFPGRYVKINDTIAGFKAILDGDVDEVPEGFFSYKGTLDEVMDAYKKSQN
mgnify:CR=1 FL=1